MSSLLVIIASSCSSFVLSHCKQVLRS